MLSYRVLDFCASTHPTLEGWGCFITNASATQISRAGFSLTFKVGVVLFSVGIREDALTGAFPPKNTTRNIHKMTAGASEPIVVRQRTLFAFERSPPYFSRASKATGAQAVRYLWFGLLAVNSGPLGIALFRLIKRHLWNPRVLKAFLKPYLTVLFVFILTAWPPSPS